MGCGGRRGGSIVISVVWNLSKIIKKKGKEGGRRFGGGEKGGETRRADDFSLSLLPPVRVITGVGPVE